MSRRRRPRQRWFRQGSRPPCRRRRKLPTVEPSSWVSQLPCCAAFGSGKQRQNHHHRHLRFQPCGRLPQPSPPHLRRSLPVLAPPLPPTVALEPCSPALDVPPSEPPPPAPCVPDVAVDPSPNSNRPRRACAAAAALVQDRKTCRARVACGLHRSGRSGDRAGNSRRGSRGALPPAVGERHRRRAGVVLDERRAARAVAADLDGQRIVGGEMSQAGRGRIASRTPTKRRCRRCWPTPADPSPPQPITCPAIPRSRSWLAACRSSRPPSCRRMARSRLAPRCGKPRPSGRPAPREG